MAGEVEEDDALVAFRVSAAGLLDGGLDGVRALRSGEDALGAGEEDGGLEAGALAVGDASANPAATSWDTNGLAPW
jgi:hypothetical protein